MSNIKGVYVSPPQWENDTSTLFYPQYPQNTRQPTRSTRNSFNTPVNGRCLVNVDNDTPENTLDGLRREMQLGPASIKNLSTGIPNFYPTQKISKLVGTSDLDLSKWEKNGKRISYGYQVVPFHHFMPRDVQEYGFVIKGQNLFEYTKYPLAREGYWGR